MMWAAVREKRFFSFSCRVAAGGFLVTALVLGTALLDSPAVYAADQNIAAAHSDKGLLLTHAGDLAGAESELRAAVALAPNNSEYLSNLATVLAIRNWANLNSRYTLSSKR
jgi:Flp pilus assembly protein TadD